jgi:signal transduction histidine kinase
LIEVTFSEVGDHVCVHVRDNGEGFEQARAKHFFERGFSSRDQKSGGLGLHWCANALSLMRGTLALTSDGAGLGATATITLPKSDPEALILQPQHPGDNLAPGLTHDIAPEGRAPEMQSRR